MKADQERVKALLAETVILLCKNGLCFTSELKVQGLLGITLDNDDTFLVSINETVSIQEDSISCNKSEHSCRSNSDEITSQHNEEMSFSISQGSFMESSSKNPQTRPMKRRKGGLCERKGRKAYVVNSNSSFNPIIKSEVDFNDCESSSGLIQIISEFTGPATGNDCKGEVGIRPYFLSNPTMKSSFLADSPEPIFFKMGGEQNYPSFLDDAPQQPQHINHSAFCLEAQSSSGMQEQSVIVARKPSKSWTLTPRLTGRTVTKDQRKCYTCEFDGCNLSFYQSSTLYRHQRIKHGRRFGVVDQRSFFCPFPDCGRVFYRELALIKHQRHVHSL